MKFASEGGTTVTDREREFAGLGLEYAANIEACQRVILPSGRYAAKTARGTWEVQPWFDNYWLEFEDLLDAVRCATRPKGCRCGSGLPASPEYDGEGIFLTYCCDRCRAEKLSHFRPDVKERYFDPLDAGESLEEE
jgi:hypothetical protein